MLKYNIIAHKELIMYGWLQNQNLYKDKIYVYPVEAFEFEIKEVNITVRNINHQESSCYSMLKSFKVSLQSTGIVFDLTVVIEKQQTPTTCIPYFLFTHE